MMVLSAVAFMAQLAFFIVNVTLDGIGKSFATIAAGARLLPEVRRLPARGCPARPPGWPCCSA
jgi:hypothetical protein